MKIIVMSMQIAVFCVLLITFTVAYKTAIQCPINEEYNECGTACQENCTHKPEFCTLQCVSGCFCQEGFVREGDERSPCIRRYQCPCRANEKFNPCGSACPDTCGIRSERCTKQCVPGCFCRDGFILANNRSRSLCIPPSECNNPSCQDPNAEYMDCGPTCPLTCDDEWNPIRKFRICPAICQSGCFCKKGFVLDKDGRCVRPDSCCSSINGVYQTCAAVCPRSCRMKNNVLCPFPCTSGCSCAEGYVRRDSQLNSTCVPISAC